MAKRRPSREWREPPPAARARPHNLLRMNRKAIQGRAPRPGGRAAACRPSSARQSASAGPTLAAAVPSAIHPSRDAWRERKGASTRKTFSLRTPKDHAAHHADALYPEIITIVIV